MKKIFLTIILGFAAGIAGSFFYDSYLKMEPTETSQVTHVDNENSNHEFHSTATSLPSEKSGVEDAKINNAEILRPSDFVEASQSKHKMRSLYQDNISKIVMETPGWIGFLEMALDSL
jgi:hypothetical protein